MLMGHRYYDPGTGRFLTRDPIGYGGGMNLYGYADGNPVNESDPSGLDPNDTNGGVGHLLPNANAEYSDPYQQFTQGQVPEYGDNYHGMARVGGGGPSFVDAIGNFFRRIISSVKSAPSPRMQRGMVMTPGGRPSRLSDRVTKALPEGEGLSPAENVQARNYFERNRELARKRWSERTGQPWPANTTHDEHPRPLKDGGDPLFIEPGFDGPANPHKGRDFSRWGKLGGRPRKNR